MKPSFQTSLDWLFAILAGAGVLATLQTFIIGKHYIIPTAVLTLTVFFGVISVYGLKGQRWAKHLLFWLGFVLTAHLFFALFWSKAYRDLLGGAFEPVCGLLFVIMGFLVYRYARINRLFSSHH